MLYIHIEDSDAVRFPESFAIFNRITFEHRLFVERGGVECGRWTSEHNEDFERSVCVYLCNQENIITIDFELLFFHSHIIYMFVYIFAASFLK